MSKVYRLIAGRKKPVSIFMLRGYLYLLSFLLFSAFIISGLSIKAEASIVAEEFLSGGSFQEGLVVSIDTENPNQIVLSNLQNSEYVLGVVNSLDSSLVTYAKDGAEVSVSLAGEVPVFVSDANGPINVGDFIGASWLEGVGMKAQTTDRQKLVGVALDAFDGSDGQSYGEIETNNGTKEVTVSTIRVRLFEKEGFVGESELGGFEGFVNSLAGKPVSYAKVIGGTVIFMMGVLIAGFFVSSSIRGSFISIGRNPLASVAIYRNLAYVTAVSVGIILTGTMLAYIVFVI